jgi:VanZ family protein
MMNDRFGVFLRTWLPVFLWMLFIFILSSVPGRDIPNLPIPFFHKGVHFFEYSVLGALWMRGFTYGRSGVKLFKLSVLAWVLTGIFALSDEWHQTFIPGRSGRLEDVRFDVICAIVGILFYSIIRKELGRKGLRANEDCHA